MNDQRRQNWVILGPQGVGKGTQAALLSDAFGLEHLSTGAILRRAVADGSALGRAVAGLLVAGDLVPDDLVLDIVLATLERAEAEGRGCVLDGFPRTVGQAVSLSAARPGTLTTAIELDVPVDVLLDRLARRRVCTRCETTILVASADIDEVPCPYGDGVAARRNDDTPEGVSHRLDIYERCTRPLAEWFRGAGHLVTVCGSGTPAAVHQRIMGALTDRDGTWSTPSLAAQHALSDGVAGTSHVV